jgi:hypothetical protein
VDWYAKKPKKGAAAKPARSDEEIEQILDGE